MKTLNELFRDVICLNEVDGNMNAVCRFSDPDGKSGRSGYSFGLTQMDTRHNDGAINCLVDCGFTTDEIHGIVDQTIDVRPFTVRLIAHKDTIEKYDEAQLGHCIDKAKAWIGSNKLPMVDTSAVLMICDAWNQMGSLGTGSASHLASLNRPVTAKDVLDMKLAWKYATESKEGRADTIRRYDNVLKVVADNAV